MSKADLMEAYAKFNEKHEFYPGQIVEWKRGMAHKRPDGPFVVLEVLAEPVLDPRQDAGLTYFREPLDIVLGHFDDDDGAFVQYYYDSRRFQPV